MGCEFVEFVKAEEWGIAREREGEAEEPGRPGQSSQDVGGARTETGAKLTSSEIFVHRRRRTVFGCSGEETADVGWYYA